MLFNYQRDHIISTSDESVHTSSDQGISKYYNVERYHNFASNFLDFKVRSRFEKKLLNGVLGKQDYKQMS